MLNEQMGLNLLVEKEPVVATHVGEFDPESTIATYSRYEKEQRTFVVAPEILDYQNELIETVLNDQTAIGCLVAPFGYGKTSTVINIWRACNEANLLAIPPFSCNSIAEMGQAIASAVIHYLNQAGQIESAGKVEQAYDDYLVSSAQRLAEQDAEKYGIEYETALESIREKIENGQLQLEASGTNLLQFLEKIVRIAVDAEYKGVIVLVDEFQQFLGNINKGVITNFRTLIWGLRTRGNLPLGFVLTMDPDTERNLIDRGADILHRIRNDGLYMAFADVYDREFPRELWSRYAEAFGFLDKNQKIVDLPTLEAIGQICERADLSNGPRTTINIFQRIASSYSKRNRPYSPIDLIDDFLTGDIRFDGDRGKIPSLVNELISYDYIQRVPERIEAIKLISAFPRGCSYELAERYELLETFSFLADELQGEVLQKLPDGVALIDLQKVGKPQDKLSIILKKYWMQITEEEIIADRAQELFAKFGVEPLFPDYISINEGWKSLTDGFELTQPGSYFQLYEGTFFSEYPLRRVAVQVCTDLKQTVVAKDIDAHFVLLIQLGEAEVSSIPNHLNNSRTLILPVSVNDPFDRRLPRDVRDIENFLSPVVLTPGVLVSLLNYIDEQVPQIEGMSEAESQRIEDKTRKLQEFLLTMVFSDRLFAEYDIQVFTRGAQAVRDALFRILRSSYPQYQTLVSSPSWKRTLETYEAVLSDVDTSQRRGLETLKDEKARIAAAFGQRSHAGFESYARQFVGLLNVVAWRGDKGEIEFTKHPAEQILIEAISVDGGADLETINREAREFGYLPEEVEYLLEFLQLRGYIDFDKDENRYRQAHTLSEAELISLAHGVHAEASLLDSFVETDMLKLILKTTQELKQSLRDEIDADMADVQVQLLQYQRQIRQLRPDLVQSMYDRLHEGRKYLYEIHKELNQEIPESTTGLQLDTHINGAQRSIQKSIKPVVERLEALQTEIGEVTGRSVDIESFALEQLEEFVTTLDDLIERIADLLQTAEKHSDRIQLHHKWLFLVERIQRLFDSIALAKQFTDVTQLERRINELNDSVQQELATRGTQEYQAVFDEYHQDVEQFGQELDRLVKLVQQSEKSTQTASSQIPSKQGFSSIQGVSLPDSINSDSVDQTIVEQLFYSSELDPQGFIDYLIELERQGKIHVGLLEDKSE